MHHFLEHIVVIVSHVQRISGQFTYRFHQTAPIVSQSKKQTINQTNKCSKHAHLYHSFIHIRLHMIFNAVVQLARCNITAGNLSSYISRLNRMFIRHTHRVRMHCRGLIRKIRNNRVIQLRLIGLRSGASERVLEKRWPIEIRRQKWLIVVELKTNVPENLTSWIFVWNWPRYSDSDLYGVETNLSFYSSKYD